MTGTSRGRGPRPGRGWTSVDHDGSRTTARCRHCRETLTYVPDVGWVNPAIGGAYDMCDADPYANHEAGRSTGSW